MTNEEIKVAYDDWFFETFGVPVTHEYPLRYSDTAIQSAFEAGVKLGASEVKQTNE
jgi:hypothetical protein